MKIYLLFSFLAVGLTFAAPTVSPDIEHESRGSLCQLLCTPGSSPVWHAESQECICDKTSKRQEGFPDPKTCPTIRCAYGPPRWIEERKHCECPKAEDVDPKTCPTIRCAGGYIAVWIPGERHCICKRLPDRHPVVKLNESLSGREAFAAHTASCQKKICKPGQIPWYDTKTKTCNCVLDQRTCPTIKCTKNTVPVYNTETNTCGCKEKPCEDVLCISEKIPTYNSTTKLCSCTWLPDFDPEACSGLMCIAEQRPIYNKETGKCGCQWIPGLEPVKPWPTPAVTDPCDGTWCIAEKRPTPDYTTGTCSCVWIPGLEPPGPSIPGSTTTSWKPPQPTTKPIDPCSTVLCIAEKTPTVNPITKKCECKWLPGIGDSLLRRDLAPASKIPVEPPPLPILGNPCGRLICISEMHGVYNATSKRCECQWIPGLKPGNPSIPSPNKEKRETPTPTPIPTYIPDPDDKNTQPAPSSSLPDIIIIDPLGCWRKFYCPFGNNHQYYDLKTRTCKCPPKDPEK